MNRRHHRQNHRRHRLAHCQGAHCRTDHYLPLRYHHYRHLHLALRLLPQEAWLLVSFCVSLVALSLLLPHCQQHSIAILSIQIPQHQADAYFMIQFQIL
jgi:hypothetical protein